MKCEMRKVDKPYSTLQPPTTFTDFIFQIFDMWNRDEKNDKERNKIGQQE